MTSCPETFPASLRYWRTTRRMPQAELAATAGLEPSAISHFESGRRSPSLANLCRLANALNVSIGDLVERA